MKDYLMQQRRQHVDLRERQRTAGAANTTNALNQSELAAFVLLPHQTSIVDGANETMSGAEFSQTAWMPHAQHVFDGRSGIKFVNSCTKN
jgi:hypothetical protein